MKSKRLATPVGSTVRCNFGLIFCQTYDGHARHINGLRVEVSNHFAREAAR